MLIFMQKLSLLAIYLAILFLWKVISLAMMNIFVTEVFASDSSGEIHSDLYGIFPRRDDSCMSWTLLLL